MSAISYHKLVRDRIPEIIEADGKVCICETLSDEDYIYLLDQKLNEELAEYQESKSLEELADLLEVMQAVAKARGWTLEELERVRANKAAKRGGLCIGVQKVDGKVYLICTMGDGLTSYSIANNKLT